MTKPEGFTYDYGTPLQKKKGSQWRGFVRGFYTSSLTVEGYCIESMNEKGSVQLYPLEALEPLTALQESE